MDRPIQESAPHPRPRRTATREAERSIDQGAPRAEIAARLRQQAVLADFAAFALRAVEFDALLQRASELCAEGMKTPLAKVLEWEPDTRRLRVRAGVGWRPGVVGEASVGADLESPAGYALHTGRPVVSDHLDTETRFRVPQLLADHGVKRAVNVLIRASGAAEPFGVLEADSSSSGRFQQADLAFMQGLADLLGGAIASKRLEAALFETQERLLAALDAAEMGSLDYDSASGRLHLDDRCKALLGIPLGTEMSLDDTLALLSEEDRDKVHTAMRQALDPAGPGEFHLEVRAWSPEDGDHWISGRGRVLAAPRRPPRLVGIAWDITSRRRTEQLMREALEHQEVLVHEVSHRVKNSLQLVAGVLSLQARAAGEDDVREALTVAQSRVQAIAQVHDHLWRQPDVQEVELSGFLRSLCDKLQEGAPGHRLSFEGPPTPIATDLALPLALVVNELVTNAFKYAYPDGQGEVRVRLHRDGDRLQLEVSDFGVGLPPGAYSTQEGGSLGMKVVSTLERQLRADLEVGSNAPGARFVLTFDRVQTPEGA